MSIKPLVFFRKNIVAIVLIVILVSALIYIYFPRSISSLIAKRSDDIVRISIVKSATDSREQEDILFSDEKKTELLEVISEKYARIKIFPTKSTSKDYIGYYIFVSHKNQDNSDIIFLFTENIISVNGTQYKIYGKSISKEINQIIESEDVKD